MPVQYDHLTIERVCHSTVRIETNDGTVVYIDPWSGGIDSEPRDGDIIFVTHDDSDHYDPDGIAAVAKQSATVAAYETIATDELEVTVTDLAYESTGTVGEIGVQTVPAYNDPSGDHVDETGDPYHAQGEVIGLQLEIDGTAVFFPSDTDVLPHHTHISTDVLLPPIGGTYTMDRHEAAELVRSVTPEVVLPVHYDTFDAIETDVDAFVAEITSEGIAVELG